MAGRWDVTPIPAGRTDAQWAWAAALFEGEGCIYSPYRSLPGRAGGGGMVINMTDRDVLERFSAIVGVGRLFDIPRANWMKPHWKDQHRWITTKFSDVVMLYGQFREWLGGRRRAKFDDVIANPPKDPRAPRKDFCKRGHALVGEGALIREVDTRYGGIARICLICVRASRARYKARKRLVSATAEQGAA